MVLGFKAGLETRRGDQNLTNFPQGEKLVSEAKQIFSTLIDLLRDKSWNIVVRRSQEVVELSLKGLLKIMGVEYPKVHDVGVVLRESLKERRISVKEEKLSKIEEISAYLARERAPAFYYEKEYTEEEAKRAKDYAQQVLEFARESVERLK